jgi:hypothetical protein
MKNLFLAGASALALCLAASQSRATLVTLSYTGAIQTFTVPTDGEYTITADGAQGGDIAVHPGGGGLGAEVSGDFYLTAGTVLDVVVGGAGGFPSGGGGGSFVYTTLNALLLAAGGGGGAGPSVQSWGVGGSGLAGQSGGAGTAGGPHPGAGGTLGSGGAGGQDTGRGGGGGGGWAGNGTSGSSGGGGGQGFPTFAGGAGNGSGAGGFGGGGGAGFGPAGGGGGGYSGGGGGGDLGAGGGGGSFIALDAANAAALAAFQSGDGEVTFDLQDVTGAAVPEPASAVVLLSAFTGMGLMRRRRR